jgi:Lon protease-like protein
MDELLLPIFPLELVLLPEEILPLHIFEERYKLMIGECLAARESKTGQQEFGVVFARGNEIETVGCCARILNVIRKYNDGRMDIATVGGRRFEILYTDEKRPYLRGGIALFDDDPGVDTASDASAAKAIDLFRNALQRLRKSTEIPVHLPPPYRHLSFRMGASLPLKPGFKQRLLSIHRESERLDLLIATMKTMVTQLDFVEKARKKSGGNGHALGNA